MSERQIQYAAMDALESGQLGGLAMEVYQQEREQQIHLRLRALATCTERLQRDMTVGAVLAMSVQKRDGRDICCCM